MGADTRKFAYLELRGLKRDGTFSGYASIFGEVDLGKMPAPETEVRCTPAPSGQAENPRADRGGRALRRAGCKDKTCLGGWKGTGSHHDRDAVLRR
jgi:hypothetical protein